MEKKKEPGDAVAHVWLSRINTLVLTCAALRLGRSLWESVTSARWTADS